jgi:hypothetical protein
MKTTRKLVYTVNPTPTGLRVFREFFIDGASARKSDRFFRNTNYGSAKHKVDRWIHSDLGSLTTADCKPAPEVEIIGHVLSAPAQDPAELRKAAKYALAVFAGHCNSNVHSLGCACALSWLKHVLDEPLTDEDKRNLQSINVHVPQ